jgi:hypothetical protein
MMLTLPIITQGNPWKMMMASKSAHAHQPGAVSSVLKTTFTGDDSIPFILVQRKDRNP